MAILLLDRTPPQATQVDKPVAEAFAFAEAEGLSFGGAGSFGFDPASNGLANIVNRGFLTKAANDADRGTGSFPDKVGGSEGWDGQEWNKVNVSIATDANEPDGKSLRWNYPVGLTAGSGPGIVQTQSFGAAVHGSRRDRELYVRGSFRLGPTYYVGSIRNKFYFHRTNQVGSNKGEPYVGFGPAGSHFYLYVNFQGTPDNNLPLSGGNGLERANSGTLGASLSGDTRYWLETYVTMNSAYGVADGIFRAWVNGELCIERTNCQIRPDASTYYWDQLHCSPTYSGTGGPANTISFDLFAGEFDVWGKP